MVGARRISAQGGGRGVTAASENGAENQNFRRLAGGANCCAR
jgi:hypothetical protein